MLNARPVQGFFRRLRWAADGILIVFRGLQSAGTESVAKPGLQPDAPGRIVSYERREEPWPR